MRGKTGPGSPLKPESKAKAANTAALSWLMFVQMNLMGLWIYAGSAAMMFEQHGPAAGAYLMTAVNGVLLVLAWRLR